MPSRARATQLPLTPRFVSRPQVTRTAVQTATFQLLASIAAPFVVIHTAVDLAKRSLAHTRAARIGPVVAGLALIPALPLVDHPIEHGARVVKQARAQTQITYSCVCCVRVFADVARGCCAAIEAAFDSAWPRSAEGADGLGRGAQ